MNEEIVVDGVRYRRVEEDSAAPLDVNRITLHRPASFPCVEVKYGSKTLFVVWDDKEVFVDVDNFKQLGLRIQDDTIFPISEVVDQ